MTRKLSKENIFSDHIYLGRINVLWANESSKISRCESEKTNENICIMMKYIILMHNSNLQLSADYGTSLTDFQVTLFVQFMSLSYSFQFIEGFLHFYKGK